MVEFRFMQDYCFNIINVNEEEVSERGLWNNGIQLKLRLSNAVIVVTCNLNVIFVLNKCIQLKDLGRNYYVDILTKSKTEKFFSKVSCNTIL